MIGSQFGVDYITKRPVNRAFCNQSNEKRAMIIFCDVIATSLPLLSTFHLGKDRDHDNP